MHNKPEPNSCGTCAPSLFWLVGSEAIVSVSDKPLPYVSVVIAAYNRRALVLQCLDSLCRQQYPRDRDRDRAGGRRLDRRHRRRRYRRDGRLARRVHARQAADRRPGARAQRRHSRIPRRYRGVHRFRLHRVARLAQRAGGRLRHPGRLPVSAAPSAIARLVGGSPIT